MALANNFQISNLNAPMLYLEPGAAAFVPFCQYVVVSSTAIQLYDLLGSFLGDYGHLSQHRFGFMSAIFVVSRLSCFSFLLMCCLNLIAPLGEHCEAAVIIGAVACIVSRGTTSALFFVRVWVVYPRNRRVKGLFAVLWCAVVGGAFSTIFSVFGVRIGPTKYCIPVTSSLWEVIFMVSADAAFDIFACGAIAYQMRHYWTSEGGIDECNMRSRWLFFPARRDSKLADRFLRDSQTYVLLTILIKLPEIIVFVYFTLISPSSSGIGIVLVYPDAAISNILAAKIYRNMKLKRPGILPVRRSGNNGTFATHPTISLSLPQFASPMDSDNDIPLTKINARASSWH